MQDDAIDDSSSDPRVYAKDMKFADLVGEGINRESDFKISAAIANTASALVETFQDVFQDPPFTNVTLFKTLPEQQTFAIRWRQCDSLL